MNEHRQPIPVSLFSIVLGLTGLGNGWRLATRIWGMPAYIGESILLVAGVLWLVLMVLYLCKWLFARAAALTEFRHEIQSGFVALVPLTTMLMALLVLPYARDVAIALWVFGVGGQLAYGSYSAGRIWQGGRDPLASTTVLYLPTVGVNFVAAIVAGSLGYPGWGALFFGAGALAWLSLESVILQRHMGPSALPATMRATVGIQLAPPVVGALAYLSITSGMPDMVAQALFGYGLLQGLLMVRLVPWFRQQSFSPSLWAFTFGVTSIAAAPMHMLERGSTGPAEVLAWPLFAFANLFVGALGVGTLRFALRGRGRLLTA
jgi:tellurite resistance protein